MKQCFDNYKSPGYLLIVYPLLNMSMIV